MSRNIVLLLVLLFFGFIKSNGRVLLNVGEWDNNPIMLTRHKLLYFSVPKNACTEFKKLSRRMAGLKNWNLVTQDHSIPHAPYQNGLKYLGFRAASTRAILKDSSWRKFIVVREPTQRLLSAYLDKVLGGKYASVNRKYGFHRKSHPSFSTFVDDITLHGFEDPHWERQAVRMAKWMPLLNDLDIIRFSHVHEDTHELLTRYGLYEQYAASGWGPDKKQPFLQMKSSHSHNSENRYEKYYTRELQERVMTWYKQDYELFHISYPTLL